MTERDKIRSILGLDTIAPQLGLFRDGENGVRSVDNPCGKFELGEPGLRGDDHCWDDGHYLCLECVWLAAFRVRELENE